MPARPVPCLARLWADWADGRGRRGAGRVSSEAGRGGAGRGSGGAGLRPAGRCRRAGLLPFPPAAPAAAALPGRRGGGAEALRRLLLFSRAPLGAVFLGSDGVGLSRFLSAPHSRRLTTTAAAAAGGAWRFEAERRRGEGRGGGGGGARAGGGAVCPGTERPRPWRTPISSSTLSSATQPPPPGASPPAAPLYFRSAGAGDVGTASGRGLAGPGRPAAPAPALQLGVAAAVSTRDLGSV
ncbi:hypothetical protein J1605_001885 [Eschrichtius robustus]|uniref:Uncharacterized protein n=1 Tax=Eschrichtius robustus TaxID=9764 RepID=A0AB34I286_ESCRO|nr:hypothetical protein J1605_001885 [Eschrichtius robustus]